MRQLKFNGVCIECIDFMQHFSLTLYALQSFLLQLISNPDCFGLDCRQSGRMIVCKVACLNMLNIVNKLGWKVILLII